VLLLTGYRIYLIHLPLGGWRIVGQWGDMAIKIVEQDIKDTCPQLSGSQFYSEIIWNIGAQLLEGKLELVMQQSIIVVDFSS